MSINSRNFHMGRLNYMFPDSAKLTWLEEPYPYYFDLTMATEIITIQL